MTSETTTTKCPFAQMDDNARKITKYISKRLAEKYLRQKPLRAFHPKSIGLVKATLKVEDNLEPFLKQGLFTQAGTYNALIRFSNASPNVSEDRSATIRGMAIKILNLKSFKFWDEDNNPDHVQDIVLQTSPTFFPGTSDLILNGVKLALGTSFFEKAIAVVKIALVTTKGFFKFLRSANFTTYNILEEMYYSASPYAFGEGKAIKWHARPCKTIVTLPREYVSMDFLHEQLAMDLRKEKANYSFELFVQFHENEISEPIDNTAIEWKTSFHKVAELHIEKQEIDNEQRRSLDVQTSFCPGHAICAHAPLGSINLLRAQLYNALAKVRSEYPNNECKEVQAQSIEQAT